MPKLFLLIFLMIPLIISTMTSTAFAEERCGLNQQLCGEECRPTFYPCDSDFSTGENPCPEGSTFCNHDKCQECIDGHLPESWACVVACYGSW